MIGSLFLVTAIAFQTPPAVASTAPDDGARLGEAYFLFVQGCALEADNDLPGAISAYRKAAELWPTGADIHAELAGVLGRTGKTDEAIKEATTALAADADNRLAHRTLGLVQASLAGNEKDPARATSLRVDAIKHLEFVVRQRLVDENANLALGRLYVGAGRDAQAIEMLRNLLLDDPESPEALVLLGQAYEHSRQLGPAVETVQGLAEVLPNQPRVLLWLAELEEQNRQWSDAAGVWHRLGDRDKSDLTLKFHEASALINAGDASRAVAVLEDVRRSRGPNADLLFNLGTAYERAGQADQAERAFREVLAEQPSNAEALNYLGYMLADRGAKLEEAVTFIKRALAVDADNPSFLDSLGWAYFKQSKLQQARDPLQRAAAALPANSVIQDHLGELYFKLKQYREAAAAWDRALSGDLSGVDRAAIIQKRDRARALVR
jgi:tetratricopeptide (TPR) repeat protein